MSKRKQADPIPDEFTSYEEAAEFWDTHDTTDYPDAFRTVEVVTEFRSRYYEIEIDADVINALRVQSQREGITISHLANELLRQKLAISG